MRCGNAAFSGHEGSYSTENINWIKAGGGSAAPLSSHYSTKQVWIMFVILTAIMVKERSDHNSELYNATLCKVSDSERTSAHQGGHSLSAC